MCRGNLWVLYLLTIFGGGPLVAPFVYDVIGLLAQTFPTLHAIAQAPFHRYVTRCMLVIAVVGLWPLFKVQGYSSWDSVGLPPLRRHLRFVVLGFGMGFLSLGFVLAAALAGEGRTLNIDADPGKLFRHLVNAGLAAAVVGPVEEILFRGALFGAIRRQRGWKIALLVSSLMYSLVHFLDRGRWTGPVVWYSGFFVLGKMFIGTGDLSVLIPRFLSLLVAGGVLGLAYQRTGNLWFSIGLHAGWIFWLKSYGFITEQGPSSALWFWGSGRLIDGWFAVITITGVFALIWKCVHGHPVASSDDGIQWHRGDSGIV